MPRRIHASHVKAARAAGLFFVRAHRHTAAPVPPVAPKVQVLGRVPTFVYGTLNRPVKVTDPLGTTITMVYDATNGQVSVARPGVGRATSADDERNRQTATGDALSHRTTFVYDTADRRPRPDR